MDEFIALLSIPNIATDHANIQRNAEFIAKMLEKRGVAAPKLVSIPGANPVVFGEIRTPGASRTLVFYAHYDGQPLDPKEWATPPFQPVLRDESLEKDGRVIPLPASPFDPESRIYARSAGDDKNNVMTIVTAIDVLRTAGMKTRSNIKFAFEGEEEAGSINLGENSRRQPAAVFGRHMVHLRRPGASDGGGNCSPSARAASPPSTSRSTAPAASCTADITGTGRRIRP